MNNTEYYKRLNEKINGRDTFFRSFYGKCPKCSERIWSIDEKHDTSEPGSHKLVAYFICTCGAKSKQVVMDTKHPKYRYPQALATNIKYRGSEVRVLKAHFGNFIVTPEGIAELKMKPPCAGCKHMEDTMSCRPICTDYHDYEEWRLNRDKYKSKQGGQR